LKRNVSICLFLTLVALAVVVAATQETAETPSTPEAPAAVEIKSVAGTAASVVAKDPATGELRSATADEIADLLSEDMRSSLSRSSVDLVEVESPSPGGGVMVDLKGRFHSVQWAVRDAEGRLHTECLSGDPKTHGADAPAVHESNAPAEQR